ncbi:glycosyltransferase family 4 protein [bacterium AH-315-P15]|nr:glycosyltransferase family 4 protein [bacterium AH-315-P15]
MKINVVVGGRFQVAQTYHALVSAGHNVHLYTSSPKSYFCSIPNSKLTFVPKPAQIAQKTFRVRMPRLLSEWNAIWFDTVVAGVMRSADVVWGFNGDSLSCGRKIKRLGGSYVVDRACPHFDYQQEILAQEAENIGYRYAEFSDRMSRRFNSEYAIADKIVVPSRYSFESFVERGYPRDKLCIAPLDSNAPAPSDKTTGNKKRDDGGSLVVGLVGGSYLRKGIIYLLRAIDQLENGNIVVRIRATPKNVLSHKEGKMLCDRLGVEFVPYVEDINDFYQGLDVFVLPSIDEGFGMVAYEALANGIPLIASTNVGAIDGFVPDKDILVFPAGDSNGLATLINRLFKDPAFRHALGKAGHAAYVNRMSAGANYSSVVDELIESLRQAKV